MKHPVNVGDTMDGKKVVQARWFMVDQHGPHLPFYLLEGENQYRQFVPDMHDVYLAPDGVPDFTPLHEMLPADRLVDLLSILERRLHDRPAWSASTAAVDPVTEAEDQLYIAACKAVTAALCVPVVCSPEPVLTFDEWAAWTRAGRCHIMAWVRGEKPRRCIHRGAHPGNCEF